MNVITEQAAADLQKRIFLALMSHPDTDMGDMNNAQESAECIVSEWMDANWIIIANQKNSIS
jgi:hypothetical protein